MEKKVECGIVYDLLPNYVENVTNEYSNKFIEEHLSICKKCKNDYNNLKKKMNINSSTKVEINFLKKYRKHLKVLNMIILSIVLLVIGLTVNTIRKVTIIKDMQNKILEYSNSDNYYIKAIKHGNNEETIIETYKKDNVILQKITRNSKEGESSLINYSNNKKINTYIDSGTSKIAVVNVENSITETNVENWVYTQNEKECIMAAFMSSIKREKVDGKYVYRIKNFYPAQKFITDFDNFYFYIDKETGLMIKNSENDGTNYEYQFNVVTDKDLIEPNIEEYTIVNTN